MFGIRANRKLTFSHLLQSIFWPNQNEFIPILFYIGFGIYFLVETILISSNFGVYGTLKSQTSSLYIFFVTFVIFVHFALTTVYLIFYPKDI